MQALVDEPQLRLRYGMGTLESRGKSDGRRLKPLKPAHGRHDFTLRQATWFDFKFLPIFSLRKLPPSSSQRQQQLLPPEAPSIIDDLHTIS